MFVQPSCRVATVYYMFNCSFEKAFCRGRDRATLVALVRLLFADKHQLSVYSTLREQQLCATCLIVVWKKRFVVAVVGLLWGPGRATFCR